MGLMDKMATSMLPEMIEKMVAGYEPEKTEKLVKEIMDGVFSKVDIEKISSIMHDMMPAVIEGFFAKINKEQREEMLSLYRNVLDSMEKKYTA